MTWTRLPVVLKVAVLDVHCTKNAILTYPGQRTIPDKIVDTSPFPPPPHLNQGEGVRKKSFWNRLRVIRCVWLMIFRKMNKINPCVNTFCPGLYKWLFVFFPHGLTQTRPFASWTLRSLWLKANSQLICHHVCFKQGERYNCAIAIIGSSRDKQTWNQGEYAFPEEQFEDSLSETCRNIQNLSLYALSDQQGEEETWSWCL